MDSTHDVAAIMGGLYGDGIIALKAPSRATGCRAEQAHAIEGLLQGEYTR